MALIELFVILFHSGNGKTEMVIFSGKDGNGKPQHIAEATDYPTNSRRCIDIKFLISGYLFQHNRLYADVY